MKPIKPLILSALLLITISSHSQSITSFSQSTKLLDQLPTTKEEFVASEPNVLATIDWFENTPPDQEVEKRDNQKMLFLAWITNSPTVTIEINSDIMPFNKKNPELLLIFMAGWTRYALQNNYSGDKILGSTARIKSVITVYKKGWFKKDKEMEKIIQMDDKGELDAWINSQLSKK